MDLKRLVHQLNELQSYLNNQTMPPISETMCFGYYTDGEHWQEIQLAGIRLATQEDFEEGSELRLLEFIHSELKSRTAALKQACCTVDKLIKHRTDPRCGLPNRLPPQNGLPKGRDGSLK